MEDIFVFINMFILQCLDDATMTNQGFFGFQWFYAFQINNFFFASNKMTAESIKIK